MSVKKITGKDGKQFKTTKEMIAEGTSIETTFRIIEKVNELIDVVNSLEEKICPTMTKAKLNRRGSSSKT